MKKENKTQMLKKALVLVAKKTASLEANTACPLLTYQEKEPEQVRKLRRF